MKTNFTFLCLFMAITSGFAQFVPDPNTTYNIIESNSTNVIGGTSATQPALTTKQDLTSQTFHFVAVGPANTYYIINGDNMYLNQKSASNGYDMVYEATSNGLSSEWVIEGTGATDIRLKNNQTTKYLASDSTSPGSNLYGDKSATHANGSYTTVYVPLTTLYNETFSPTSLPVADWTGLPSTLAGGNQWSGGIDVQTVGDANINLVNKDANLRLKLISTDAAVVISDINVAGYTNLQFSIDGYREGGPLAPKLEVKVGAGAWVLQSIQGVGNYWSWSTALTQIKDAGGVQLSNVSTISLRISNTNTETAQYLLDNVKILGRTASLGTNSNQLSDNSIKVYPNPFVNEFKVDATKSEGSLQVSVFDVLGRKVATAKSASSQLTMGSSLKSGVYIVKVEGANAKDSKSFKIIKK